MADLTIAFQKAGEEVVIGALRRVGEVAINALGAAFKIVGDFAADSFKGAIEAQAGIDKLTGSIVRLGDKSPVSIEQAFELAEQFKNLVGGSDDVVLAMQDVILRFDKISSDTFPRVIEQSADLAVALKTDPTRAAELLGKVLQDLGTDGVGSIGRLKAAGVALTDQQEEQIKSLVEAGKVTEAQTVLLDALAETTGGKALTNAQSFAGQWDIFKETIADAGEGVAMKFLPPLTELAERVMPIILPLIEQVAGAIGNFAELLTTGNISGALAQIGIDFNQVKEQGQPLIDAVMNITATFQESMPMIMASVQGMVDFVINLFNTFSPTIIANITSTLTTISEFWTAHGAEVMAVVSFLFNTLATVIGGALTLISGIISTTLTLVTGIWTAASALLQGDTATAWATIQATVGTALDTILATLTTILASALSITDTSLASFIASWTGTFALAQTIIQTFFANLIASWTGTFALALTIIQTFFSNLIASWTGTFSLALSIFQGFVSNTIASVAGFALSIIAQFNSIVGSIIRAFSIDWGAIGSGIIGGITQGVMNAAGGLGQAAADAANWALQQAKNALGISSPSKAFAKIGENMMAGMALGITNNMVMPANAMRSASSAVTNSTINIDARGAARGAGSEIRQAVRSALAEAGVSANQRGRMR